MCGIVGAIAQRPVADILIEGLRRLEYRGYDSAGIAVLSAQGELKRLRCLGKVAALAEALAQSPLPGTLGIAHTRWATHGEPSEHNAHPHICRDRCAIVHNGIIENHESLRHSQQQAGHRFTSQTDTEVAIHAVHDALDRGLDLTEAVRDCLKRLEGAYALGVIDREHPDRLVAARLGSPLVIGIGFQEHFIASDVPALLPVTNRFIFLEDGDIAELTHAALRIWDARGALVERPIRTSTMTLDATERGPHRHFMRKEIFEQPRAITDTLEGRLAHDHVLGAAFGPAAEELFSRVRAVTIVACGTSFHAGLVAKHWLESVAGIHCQVEVASEYRYRRHLVAEGSLFVSLSQSGETADTLAALRIAKGAGYLASLTICNVAESSLVRESDFQLLTRAGPEIGVASTKAFTTQLTALLLLTLALGHQQGLAPAAEARAVALLRTLPAQIERALAIDPAIADLARHFVEKHHTLFLGRGEHHAIAMEGALKLKEISYIHAEAYPAGELKHGPLALIDEDMPVVVVAPNNALLAKLKSNLEEVRARGGQLFVFADDRVNFSEAAGVHLLRLPETDDFIDPLIFAIPMQLLAYHVAVLKGTDVDQPRNLAKSVTVE